VSLLGRSRLVGKGEFYVIGEIKPLPEESVVLSKPNKGEKKKGGVIILRNPGNRLLRVAKSVTNQKEEIRDRGGAERQPLKIKEWKERGVHSNRS